MRDIWRAIVLTGRGVPTGATTALLERGQSVALAEVTPLIANTR